MDVLESNPCGEDEERNRKSLLNAKSSLPDDSNLNLDTLSMGMEWRAKAMTLFLSLKMEDGSLEKAMGTLTPKRVFIGFLTRIK